MAYIVGKDERKKMGGMDTLTQPGSFENIKAQFQQQQMQQPVQSQFQAPMQPQKTEDEKVRLKKQKKRYQDGGITEEEEEDTTGPTGPTGGIGGATIGAGTPARPVGRGAQAAPQQRSGSFTGLQQYIEANKPKIQQLSQDISGQIGQEAGELRGQAQQAREQFLGPQGQFAGGQEFIQKQIEQAGKQAPTQQQAERFKKFRTGAIETPGLQKESFRAKQLEQRAEKLATPGGRFSELQRLVGKQSPQYTSGQKRLDQLLLAGDPQSRQQAIRESRQATQGLGKQVGETAREIGAQKAALVQQAQTGLQQAIDAERDARQAREERLRALDVGGEISAEDLSALGLTSEQVQNLYGVDPSEYIRTGGITQDRLARINALRGLAGQETQFAPEQVYSPDEFLSAIEAGRTGYEQASQQAVEQAGADFWKDWFGSQEAGNRTLEAMKAAYEGTGDPAAIGGSAWDKASQFRRPGEPTMYEKYAAQRSAAEQAATQRYGQGLDNRGLRVSGPMAQAAGAVNPGAQLGDRG